VPPGVGVAFSPGVWHPRRRNVCCSATAGVFVESGALTNFTPLSHARSRVPPCHHRGCTNARNAPARTRSLPHMLPPMACMSAGVHLCRAPPTRTCHQEARISEVSDPRFMKREDFKAFAAQLRTKTNTFKAMKLEMAEVQQELVVLSRTEQVRPPVPPRAAPAPNASALARPSAHVRARGARTPRSCKATFLS
jgi:hypothetical protein